MNGHELHVDYDWGCPAIYFFEAVGEGVVKVGFSNDPVNRFRQIQTSCPFQLRAVAISPGSLAAERAMHGKLSRRHRRGEWFSLEQSALDLIAAEWRSKFWRLWHAFIRNVGDVRRCPSRNISLEEFEALCRYESEFANPIDRNLL